MPTKRKTNVGKITIRHPIITGFFIVAMPKGLYSTRQVALFLWYRLKYSSFCAVILGLQWRPCQDSSPLTGRILGYDHRHWAHFHQLSLLALERLENVQSVSTEGEFQKSWQPPCQILNNTEDRNLYTVSISQYKCARRTKTKIMNQIKYLSRLSPKFSLRLDH